MHTRPHTEEAKIRMRLAKIGKRLSPATEFKSGQPRSANWFKAMDKLKGRVSPMKGRSMSFAVRQKMSRAQYDRWSKVPKKQYKRHVHTRDGKYIAWRKAVFTRDLYTCQGCRQHGGYLEAHHVLSWTSFPESRYDVANGLTLCKSCHAKTDNYKGRVNNK